MSLKKKDLTTPSGLRVAANDPHLVSLGGGRLSTAVTIHYLPLGDMTIGSSPNCNISLNGSGVRSVHCTVYRNEQGEVTIIPENDARVLIDGTKITNETNLTQGAMLTIGNSNYLRFNNPAEAQLIKSTMGSNERISMPQIDFTQDDVTTTGGSNNISETPEDVLKTFNAILESQQEIYQKPNNEAVLLEKMTKIEYYNINNFHSPKVFTADSITVNAPAKDVLGPKYANFAKNLVENHKNDKNLCTKNTNEMNSKTTNYVNIPSSFIQNSNNCTTSGTTTTTTTASTIIAQNNEILTKVNNTNSNSNNNNNIGIRNNTQQIAASSYDRYPKPGSYGGLQLFPMNGINSEINTSSFERQNSYNLDNNNDDINERFIGNHINQDQQQETKITAQEQERLEEILKICTEYDRQQNQINNSNSNSNNNSVQSSPIVQNRIKTNGSLPRDKKSPFYDISSNTQSQSSSSTSSSASIHHHHHHHSKKTVFFPEKSSSSSSIQQNHHNSGYENVRLIGDRHIEIGDNNSIIINSQKSNGYENVIIGKYIPQSPRTKIRTTCPSPKKEQQQQQQHQHQHQHQQTIVHSSSSNEYAHLIQSFEEKLRMEMEAIKENSKLKDKSLGIIINSNSNNSSNSCSSKSRTQDHNDSKRQNRNINNLTLNLEMDNNDNIDKEKLLNLQKDREICLARIRQLKTKIAEVQRQEDEVLRELDMEKALVSAELSTVSVELTEMERNYINLQNKIHRLEAQRNANRVMQETQQAKLKQTIEMKQEQVTRLKNLLQENHYNDDTLKEELEKQFEWLENDRKTFEDLEFQYLEEETDWLAYREELHKDLKLLSKHIDEKRSQLLRLEQQDVENQSTACSDTKSLETDLLTLLKMLEKSREELQEIDKCIFNISGQQQPQQTQSDSEDDDGDGDDGDVDLNQIDNQYRNNLMSQSLFGSAEILSSATKPKDHKNDLMSRSVNENMFFNNIETPTTQNDSSLLKTSTPKKELKIFDISDDTALIKVRHQYTNNNDQQKNMSDITTDFVRRENHDEKDPILKLKYNVENSTSPNGDVDNNKDGGADDDDDDDAAMKHTKVNLNLSLGSDDFEVNPLERRIPSQDDIDRISKITLDAPISTKGASSKIIESIKEIERNRQLLLAQQGSHVIEHERQKMVELKKKSHDEARAQYLSSQNEEQSSNFNKKTVTIEGSEGNDLKKRVDNSFSEEIKPLTAGNHGKDRIKYRNEVEEESSQQRHSHPPEHESQHNQRPLSEANSEFSYDNLSEKQEESGGGGGGVGGGLHSLSNRLSENSEDFKRSSYNSTDTLDDDRPTNGKRGLPKHQRPLTRYLPIMSADLDLRQHIESAGHQIALCPHVFVDSYSCRGYLHKLGATFHGWSRRWFVLDRQKCALIYYSDKSERKPRGGAYFTTIDEVYLDHLNTSKSGRPHCTFIVKTKKRSYHLQAASDAAARIWIDAIITGAQGNIDY